MVLPLLCIAVGLWLRSRRFFFDPIPMWGDEAHWAHYLVTKPLWLPTVRPVGFSAVTRLVVDTFGGTEQVYRFLPWLAGIVTMILAVPLAARLFRTMRARWLFVAIIALHPMAIDYSKEFKPYSLALCLHTVCLLGAATYWERGTLRWLVLTVLAAAIGVTLAQDVVFVLPSAYLVLGIAVLRAKRMRHLVVLAAAGAFTLALLSALYWYFWRFVSSNHDRVSGLTSAWFKSWDVFYLPNEGESRLGWLARKYAEIAGFPGMRRTIWWPEEPEPGSVQGLLSFTDLAVWTLLFSAGLAAMAFGRRWRELLLVIPALLSLVALNWLTLWPLGAFRTNLFLLVYSVVVAVMAFDTPLPDGRLWGRFNPLLTRLGRVVPVAVLVFLPLLIFERDFHRTKGSIVNTEFIRLVEAALELQGETQEPEPMVLDIYLCSVWRYYTRVHPGHQDLWARLSSHFRVDCTRNFQQTALSRASKLAKGRQRFWLLLGREGFRFDGPAPRGYRYEARRRIENSNAMVVALRRR